MTDDTTKRGRPDRTRINVNQDYEVRYWCKALWLTPRRLKALVKEAGTMVIDVKIALIKRIKAA